MVLEQTAKAASPNALRDCAFLSWPGGLQLYAKPEPMDVQASNKRPALDGLQCFWTTARWKEEGDRLGVVNAAIALSITDNHRTVSAPGERLCQEVNFTPTPALLDAFFQAHSTAAKLALRDLASKKGHRVDRGLAWLVLLTHAQAHQAGLGPAFWPTALSHVMAKPHLVATDWREALADPFWSKTPLEPLRAWAQGAALETTLPSLAGSAPPRLRL